MEFQSGVVRPIGSIEEGWNIIKNDYWTFFSMMLVAIIILLVGAVILGLINNVITFGVSAILGVATANAGDAGKISAAILPQVISIFISIFTNIIVVTLSGVLFCGIYTAFSRKASGGIANFGDLFAGFQKIKSCVIVAIVLSGIQFVIALITLLGGAAVGVSAGLGMLTKDGKLNPAVFGGLFLVILAFVIFTLLINLIISALSAFVYPLISEHNLSGGQALMLSAKSGLANIGGLILLLLLLILIAVGGVLVCFVGIFFVAPIISAAMFAAYQSVFGKSQDFYRHTPPPPPIFSNQQGY